MLLRRRGGRRSRSHLQLDPSFTESMRAELCLAFLPICGHSFYPNKNNGKPASQLKHSVSNDSQLISTLAPTAYSQACWDRYIYAMWYTACVYEKAIPRPSIVALCTIATVAHNLSVTTYLIRGRCNIQAHVVPGITPSLIIHQP